ncbi:flagellar motor protein MotA [Iodidimonas gelatinilytica]|uniref:Flagellar motor protein MotA n=1 Tax=Iodidimonas gelatinilytica TaxID=1236966 RepID=A0A5A7N0C2_9PROT|nr:MotA/TolQ/ExbB proton channel family protein [Iodidimonas gelatinilytica]GEQ98192.1 flagellar motor protein MotA [Iodidimonas gelatinilytica]GER00649.1 flagellar motor protein MotA [Iodidimonas gelatinilytica]
MSALIALLSAFGLLGAAIALGGAPAAFINGAGILIVLLGTMAVTAISFSSRELADMPRTLWQLITEPQRDPTLAALTVLKLAERTRKDGMIVLKKILPSMDDTPFLANACQLILDGATAEEAEAILQRESHSVANRYLRSIEVLRRAGEVAPAMGLIGTLIGLVQMLGSLDDPGSIGPAMAVALLTTLYGAIMAHLVFIPLAAKAERIASDETLLNTVYAMGATSISRKENPRRLEMLINTVLPPSNKIMYFK